MKNPPSSIIANSPKAHATHRAFVLLDAVMGIFVCALGFSLAFSFLSLQNLPQISSYTHYKQLLLNPQLTQTQLSTHSTPTLIYQGNIHRSTESNLSFFAPTHIR